MCVEADCAHCETERNVGGVVVTEIDGKQYVATTSAVVSGVLGGSARR